MVRLSEKTAVLVVYRAHIPAIRFPMPRTRTPTSPHGLRRYALGLWLCALGALGIARFFMRAARDVVVPADAVAWIYLLGGALVLAFGVRALLVARRQARHGRDRPER